MIHFKAASEDLQGITEHLEEIEDTKRRLRIARIRKDFVEASHEKRHLRELQFELTYWVK